MTIKATRNCTNCFSAGPHSIEIDPPGRYELVTRRGIAECVKCTEMFKVRMNISRSDINPQRERTPRDLRMWSKEFNARPGSQADKLFAVDQERAQEEGRGAPDQHEATRKDVDEMIDSLKSSPVVAPPSLQAQALEKALNEPALHDRECELTVPNGVFKPVRLVRWDIGFHPDLNAKMVTLVSKYDLTMQSFVNQVVLFALDHYED